MKEILNKFNGRFINHLPTTYNSTTFMPSFTLKDTFDAEVFTIQIDSLVADPEIILENVLQEKIINKRDKKIDSIINGTAS
jgi:hypothetical protein